MTTYTVGYLTNPDKVFYNFLDKALMKYLSKENLKVIPLALEDISFYSNPSSKGFTLLNKRNPISINGFLSYGHMSPFHYRAYSYITHVLHSMKIPLLYSPSAEEILMDKLRQSIEFKKNYIPIPQTGFTFSIEGFKNLSKEKFRNTTVLKELTNYGGDGVFKYDTKEGLVNSAAKLLWRNELCLFQKYIDDSFGRSVRVLCINNKAVALAEYINKANSFISNNSFGYKFFDIVSLMKNKRKQIYQKLAENAVNAVGKPDEMTIVGVDILDSKKNGPVVLETNIWPDLFDIREATKIDVFELLAKAMRKKIEMNEAKLNKLI